MEEADMLGDRIGIMGNGKKWVAGDVVGCMLDLTSGTMSFTLNGKVCR